MHIFETHANEILYPNLWLEWVTVKLLREIRQTFFCVVRCAPVQSRSPKMPQQCTWCQRLIHANCRCVMCVLCVCLCLQENFWLFDCQITVFTASCGLLLLLWAQLLCVLETRLPEKRSDYLINAKHFIRWSTWMSAHYIKLLITHKCVSRLAVGNGWLTDCVLQYIGIIVANSSWYIQYSFDSDLSCIGRDKIQNEKEEKKKRSHIAQTGLSVKCPGTGGRVHWIELIRKVMWKKYVPNNRHEHFRSCWKDFDVAVLNEMITFLPMKN